MCPVWLGYFLLNPLRRVLEDPRKMLGSFVSPGMTVLEPGCGMGYFTLPLAQMVGEQGRVVAVDVQAKMLGNLRRRAARAGLLDRIDIRLGRGNALGVEDLSGMVDLAVALHVVHEVPSRESFLREVREALKSGGRFLMVEPKHHVSQGEFAETLSAARGVGFQEEPLAVKLRGRAALLVKPAGGPR
jgi:ubiquinone/menaquinone biosynthesis C-methylase UbiE